MWKTPLRQVVHAANECVVRVKCNAKDAVLGTIVGPDGWIITKASEILSAGSKIKPKGKIRSRLRDGRELEARIVGMYPRFDLAMLKIDAVNLPVIPWNPLQPTVGQWLATAGMSDDPLAIGIVSVPRRAIPPTSGIIGVQLVEKDGKACIEQVLPKSPADAAGLKPNDIITEIDGETAPNLEGLSSLMHRHRPGETIRLTVKRGDQTLEITVTMTLLDTPALQKQHQMNSMGVGVSRRSDDFPPSFSTIPSCRRSTAAARSLT